MPTTAKKTERKHVKIYPTERNGTAYFTVCWYVGEVRQRRNFKDEGEAETEADTIEELIEGGTGALTTAAPNDLAALSMFRAQDPDTPLPEILRAFMLQQMPTKTKPRTTSIEVCKLFKADKLADKSARHVQTVRSHIKRFEDHFGLRVFADITEIDLAAYIREVVGGWDGKKFKLSPKTRRNHIITIKSLFSWAVGFKHLPFGQPTAADALTLPEVPPKEHEVHTPTELIKLFAAARSEIVVWLALGAFAGIRDAERRRLIWGDWKEENNALTLVAIRKSGEKLTKTRRRRSITLEDCLRPWLSMLKGDANEKMVPYHNPHKITVELAKAAGVTWVDNGLRAGYVSYHFELHENAPLTSKHSGHSIRQLETEYLNLVTKAAAKAWFEITPQLVLDYCAQHKLPDPAWKAVYPDNGGR